MGLPTKPQQNACVESFIDRFRDKYLNEPLLSSLAEPALCSKPGVTITDDYNRVWSHSALANRTLEQFRNDHPALAATIAEGKDN